MASSLGASSQAHARGLLTVPEQPVLQPQRGPCHLRSLPARLQFPTHVQAPGLRHPQVPAAGKALLSTVTRARPWEVALSELAAGRRHRGAGSWGALLGCRPVPPAEWLSQTPGRTWLRHHLPPL